MKNVLTVSVTEETLVLSLSLTGFSGVSVFDNMSVTEETLVLTLTLAGWHGVSIFNEGASV